jgi:hypothetical protein
VALSNIPYDRLFLESQFRFFFMTGKSFLE